MIDTAADRLAHMIKQNAPDEPTSQEVLKYAIITLLHGGAVLAASLTVGAATGKFIETLTTLIAFAALRFLSGGFHFQSALACFIVSTVVTAGIPHVPVPHDATVYFTVVSLILLALFAPSYVEDVTRIPERHYPIFKWLSVLLVSSNLLIGSSLLALTFLIQAVFTIRIRR